MTIFLDSIIFSLQRSGGISTYWYELSRRLLASSHRVVFVEQADGFGRRPRENLPRGDLSMDGARVIRERGLPLALRRYMRISVRPGPRDLVHSSYYRTSVSGVNVLTVYDFIYELYGRGLPRAAHRLLKNRAVRRADGVICISENTKGDFLRFYPSFDEDRTRVIPLGAGSDFRPLENPRDDLAALRWALRRPYALYVGSRAPYKRFPLAVSSVSRRKDCGLVVVGGGDFTEGERALLESRLPGRYDHLTGIAAVELNVLYNNALCLLYPSEYEGFGLPLIEAMSAGCPIVAGNGSSIREVCGSAGFLLEEVDAETLAGAMEEMEKGSLHRRMREEGLRRARRYSWEACCRDTLRFYEELTGS
jgi:glycosyltransferase involved in cell wall biosynthesis